MSQISNSAAQGSGASVFFCLFKVYFNNVEYLFVLSSTRLPIGTNFNWKVSYIRAQNPVVEVRKTSLTKTYILTLIRYCESVADNNQQPKLIQVPGAVLFLVMNR